MTMKRGNHGTDVTEAQEWLTLHGFGVTIDGDFGAATDRAVRAFQHQRGVLEDGIVGETTWRLLRLPLELATGPAPESATLEKAVVSCARQHLEQRAREVGGQNCGPWVRLYCNGHDGGAYAWCCGFVSYILGQASALCNIPCPLLSTLSCDALALNARRIGRLIPGASAGRQVQPQEIRPGDLFLIHREGNDWIHTGILIDVQPETVTTIEGNSNTTGSREGHEVCTLTRSYRRLDFIRINTP